MKAVRDRLWCKTEVGGVARYEGDYYHAVSQGHRATSPAIRGSSAPCGWRCTSSHKAKTVEELQRGGRDPRVGRLAQAAVGRAGRAGESVHQRADVGVAADLEPRDRRRRRAVVSGEARGGRALPDLRWAQAAQDRRVRAKRTGSVDAHAQPLRADMDETAESVARRAAGRAHSAADDDGDLRRVGRSDQAQAGAGALFAGARSPAAAGVQRRRRGAARHRRTSVFRKAMREAMRQVRAPPPRRGRRCGRRSPRASSTSTARSKIRPPTSG